MWKKEASELKIENNKVICDCGKELGDYKVNEVFFCKKCFKSYFRAEFSPETYDVKVTFEDIFGNKGSE